MSVFKRYIGSDSNEPSNESAPSTPEPKREIASASPTPASTPSASAPSASRPASSGTRNVLSSDVSIKGTVKFTNDLVVDGRIEGEITSSGNLTVGENAKITAEIKTSTVVVYGKVHGNITATDRVELKSTAEVVGDIHAQVLAVEPGAIFVGKSTVGTPTAAAAPTKPAAAAASSPSAPAASPTPAKPSEQGTKQATLPGTQV